VTAGAPIQAGEWPESPAGARIVADPDELATFFGDRRAVHIYALADLEEPFWSGSRWYRRGGAVVGLVGLPSGEGLACYSVATRDPVGTLDLLAELAPDLPSGLLITGPAGLAGALGPVRPLVWCAPHVRHELVDRDALPPADRRVEPLGRADLPAIEALYGADPGAVFFLPHMLDDGAFVGVRDGGRLVAAAGTHVLSTRHDVAAIGAVYTAPSHRGRGLGRAVTAAVARHLLDRVATIGLNVAAANSGARHIYESIGFAPILTYDEAELV
ncbi:MAG: GNAT family N-acetyltransferase, partial [Acidimicrobiia bacterium]